MPREADTGGSAPSQPAQQPGSGSQDYSLLQRYSALVEMKPEGSDLLAEGVVLHVPGASPLAGTYHGKDEVFQYFAQLALASGGTAKTDVQDVHTEGSEAIFEQRVTATRGTQSFQQAQRLRARLRKGKIEEAWLDPLSVAVHDRFWGGIAMPLLTPSDRSFVREAVRSAASRNRPSLPSTVIALGIAVIGAIGAIVAYNWLRTWRTPVSLTLATQGVTDLAHLTLNGPDGRVTWGIQTAQVRKLSAVAGGGGSLGLHLPISAEECRTVEERLGGRCRDDGLHIGAPLDIIWTTPQSLSSQPGRNLRASRLDVSLEERGDTLRLGMLAVGMAQPRLCFAPPLAQARLTIRRGGMVRRWRLSTREIVPCGQGLQLVVGSGPGTGPPPTVELGGVEAIHLTGSAAEAVIEGLRGRLTLVPGEAHVFDSPASLAVRAPGRLVSATLAFGPSAQSLRLNSGGVTSALTEAGELVPAAWERDPGIILPIFGGLVTVLVISPLGVAIQGVMGILGRIRWPWGGGKSAA
jgi:ketosteroid isomerase-like protein